MIVNILSWLMGRAIISPDTLEKRRHYEMTGSKQTAILVYVECKKRRVIKASPYAEC